MIVRCAWVRLPHWYSMQPWGAERAPVMHAPGNSNLNPAAINLPLLYALQRIDYIVTASGAEALLLEASLIRQHQPPFNVLLKDDKQNCESYSTST